MRFAYPLLILLRILAGVQVALGVLFWTGHAYGLVSLHRGTGMLFVLALWTIAAIAVAGRHMRGLATFAIAWGVLVAGLGFTQQRILPGDMHWVVRVAHLVIGLAAMPIAERVARVAGRG